MNKFRRKLLDFKRRLSDRHMYSVVLVVTALVAGAGIYQYKKALDYQNYVNNQYNRAFYELSDYVSNIESSLAKSVLISSPAQMVDISGNIARRAAFAQANLGQLPVSHVQLDNTSKFLSQVGEYCYSLTRKILNGESITDEEYQQIEQLQKYSKILSDNLKEMEREILEGKIKFGEAALAGKKLKTTNIFSAKASVQSPVDSMENIEREFQSYPVLIYDGPFSEHLENSDPVMLQAAEEITQEQGQKIAEEFVGADRCASISQSGQTDGTISTWNYTIAQNNTKDTLSIAVTKKGGYILWMTDSRNPYGQQLDIEMAKSKAKEFLEQKGYSNMRDTYYTNNNDTATINYAYSQDGTVIYPDLVKVSVALDTGEISGFESKGYIMSHHERDLSNTLMPKSDVEGKISGRLNIESSRLVVIPSDGQNEIYCYEFKGKYSQRDFLIYINAETGREEKILMLLETPEGILTV